MKDQDTLLQDDWDWIILCDAGRADAFEQVYPMFFEGEYSRAYNGGYSYTATWFDHHFSHKNSYTLFHGGLPIYSFRVNPEEYDEREYFSEVAGWEEFEWDNRHSTCSPETVIDIVKEYDTERGFIRFLQPHNPYRMLPDIYSEEEAKEFSHNTLKRAYYNNYRWVLENIKYNLLPEISGKVAITSDHGQCLGDCGQYLHSLTHDLHDHLVTVPFLELRV